MIITIARGEFLQIVRDGRYRAAALIMLALLGVSLAGGVRYFLQARAERTEAERDAREVWLGQSAKNPHSAAHFGTYVFKPLMTLAFADPGIDPYVGSTIYLEAHKQNEAAFSRVQERTSLQRFGELTAATVLQGFLPLIVILLTFSALSEEREAGTLRQVFSLGVPTRHLVAGKALGISVAILLLVIPSTVVGAVGLSGAYIGQDPNTIRLFAMCAGYTLYLVGLLGLSISVSASMSSSRLALICLLGFWAVNVFVAPRTVSALSSALAPSISEERFRVAIAEDIRNGIDGHNPQDRRFDALRQATLVRYGVKRVEDLPVNFSGIALQASEDYSNQVFDRHFQRRWDIYERQSRLQTAAGLLAPILAIRTLSMGMAGTDVAHYRHFAVAAEVYRRTMVKMLNDDLTRRATSGPDSLASRDLWARIPDFTYRPPDGIWALDRQWLSFAVLLAWVIATWMVALLSLSHIRMVKSS